jgi:hypothetical protein
MAYPPDARSLGDLFSDLTREVTTLIRSEVALARTELSDSASRIGRHAALIAGGAILACGGLYAVIAAVVLLLVRAGLTPWVAALLVGLGILAAGGFMASTGLAALRRERLVPQETINTLKETATWKGQTTR